MANVGDIKPSPCPSCGHCPTCGRGTHQLIPWYPIYPTYPTWPQPTWIISGTTTTGTSFTVNS